MGKAQCLSMEELAMAFQSLARAIDFITSDWMANVGHVNPNLVGPACLQLQLDQAIIPETLQDMETGQSWFSFGCHSLLLTVLVTPPNRRLNNTPIVRKIAVDNSPILAQGLLSLCLLYTSPSPRDRG